MSLTAFSNAERARRLVPRLDACAAQIPPSLEAYAHAQLYAGILSDVTAGRIRPDSPETGELLELISEFCELVGEASPAATTGH